MYTLYIFSFICCIVFSAVTCSLVHRNLSMILAWNQTRWKCCLCIPKIPKGARENNFYTLEGSFSTKNVQCELKTLPFWCQQVSRLPNSLKLNPDYECFLYTGRKWGMNQARCYLHETPLTQTHGSSFFWLREIHENERFSMWKCFWKYMFFWMLFCISAVWNYINTTALQHEHPWLLQVRRHLPEQQNPSKKGKNKSLQIVKALHKVTQKFIF